MEWTVIWKIEVDADRHEEAALAAQKHAVHVGTLATCFHVTPFHSSSGKRSRLIDVGPLIAQDSAQAVSVHSYLRVTDGCLGRNGYFKSRGLQVTYPGGDEVSLQPLTSRGVPARCSIVVPMNALPELCERLRKIYEGRPDAG